MSEDAISYIGEENAISEYELAAEFLVGPITNLEFRNHVLRLSLHDRVLHFIVAHNIKPLGIKPKTVMNEEMWFMHHIKKKTSIDLAQFIFKDMTTLVKRRQSNLAYGMVISKLIHKLKIDTWNKEPKR